MREDFMTSRPMSSETYPEWKVIDLCKKFLDSLKEECAKYKTYYDWYACYAQK